MILKKKSRKIFLIPYILYSTITFFVWYKTKFDLIQFIPDFSFYFPYAYKFWGGFNSDLATQIINNIGGFDRGNWEPSPIYPLVFLFPINILGSKIIFAIEGFLVGLGCIFLLRKIIEQFNNVINEKIKLFSLIAFSLSPVMLTNTIALTTNGVFGFLLLIAITYSSNFTIRTLSLILASIVRPNFVLLIPIFLICYFKSLIPRKNDIKLTFLLVLATYTFFYITYHQNYPGNILNYFLLSAGQGFQSFGDYGTDFVNRTLDLKVKLIEAELDIKNIFSILSTPEGINFIIQLTFAKINALLGYSSQGLYQTRAEGSLWFSKILRTLYYFFFLMPGFLITLKKSFNILRNKLKSQNQKLDILILSSSFYVLFSSTLIAMPRYLFPFDFVFITLSITYWTSSIRISDKNYS